MRKSLKRIFSAALAGIVFCTAITFYPVETKAAETAADIWEGVSSADWMSYLDDNLKISQINLPGTHDSGTKRVKLSFIDATASAQCQDTTITEQLTNGIRFLDIRLEDDGEKLRLVHATTDCKSEDGSNLYLDEVLQNCYEFLEAHPTETIVMSMKKDDGKAEDAQIETYIHNYIKENPEYWYLQNGSAILKDVRKKIVLVRRYHSASDDYAGDKGVRLFWNDQSGSDPVTPPWSGPDRVSKYGWLRFCVQDRYEYKKDNKWTAVKQGLDNPPHTTNASMKAEDGKDIVITPETTYFLNFMSTAGDNNPKSSAKSINAQFLDYNNGKLEYGKNYGWIIMDFATEELAKHVYKSNKSPKLEVAGTIKALETAIPAVVTADRVLPSNGEEVGGQTGISITWSCKPSNVLRIDGTKASLICPSSGDVTANLTATVSSAGFSQQKSFTVQVKGLDAVFTDLRTALNDAQAICNDAANAKYNLAALKSAMETANALVQAGADNVTNTQVQAATDVLNTLRANGFPLKSTAELRENMLGWYPLTASSNDVSGNHNNGTAKGVTFDKENGAVFSGGSALGSYISLPAEMFDRTAANDNMTISFWVKDSRGEKSNVFGFGASKACSTGKHFIVNTNNDNKGQISISACPNGWGDDPAKIQTAAPNANTWFHLTIVMEGKTLTVYKNGVKLDSITEDYSLAEMGSNVFAYIGNAVYAHNPYGGDKDFKGNVKDFRVYGCAVAPQQAEAIFNDSADSDTSTSEEHLLAHYPLTADSKDASGNHYDAVATEVTFSLEDGAAFKGGSALSSYLSLPTELFDALIGNDRMSVSFWVKDARGSKSNVFGFGNGTQCNPDNGGSKHFIVNTNDGGSLLVNACPKGWQGNTNNIKTEAPAADTWSHLTIVMDGRTMSLYQDGAKVNTVTADYSLSEMGSVAFAYIGNAIYAHNGDSDFKGNIKDFRIYDYALGEEEANGFMDASIKEELMADLETALNLDITKDADGSLSLSITDSALTLPTTACGGAAMISWESSNPNVIDNSGKVTLPAANEPIANVTLKATVTLHGKTTEMVFHCAVYTKLNVDTADLQAVVSSVEAILAGCKEADYTVSSWEALQQSLAAAKQQLTRPGSEAEVQAASADLQAKKNALTKLGDKVSLNDLIKTVKFLKQADYTTASWEALMKALADAEEIAASNDVSQGDVDAAKAALTAKKNALVLRGDKTLLNQAIADARQLSQEDYTDESWALFQEALENIMQTVAEEDVTKEDVDNALALLQDALALLEKVTCTLTLNPDNGSDIITITVKKGEKATEPQKPEKTGFDFEGWFAEGEETAFDFENTPVMADGTLTARWKEAQGGDKPGGDTPGGDRPGGDTPGGDRPGGDTPGGDKPGGDTPGGDKPGGDTPGGSNQGGNESPKPVSISAASVKLSKTTLTYTGKVQKPKVTVAYKGKKLAAGKDYAISYSNNKKVGQGLIKVTGKGSYNGQKTVKFTIMPKKNKIVKLTAKKGRKLLVKLSLSTKKTGAKGYEISYSTKKSFKGAKKVKTSKTTYTLKKLKKGKTYYVKVRSYAKIGKKVKYGAYSKVMKKKVAK